MRQRLIALITFFMLGFNLMIPFFDDRQLTVSAFSGSGSGTEADPYQITDWGELNEIKDDKTANYILMNNLSSSTSGYSTYCYPGSGGDGWNSIGLTGDDFTGTFDGQNYTISDLKFDFSDGTTIGLFMHITNALVKNVILKDAVVSSDGTYGVAVLVAHPETSTIENVVIVNASMTVKDVSYFGTLIARGESAGDMIIENCHASGNIEIVDNQTSCWGYGGLIGRLWAGNNEVYNSSSSVNINGSGYRRIGSFIGRADDTPMTIIKNCYATGNVSTDAVYDYQYLGGFGGYMQDTIFENCYASGDVTGYQRVGGFVGRAEDCIINNSYSYGHVTYTQSEYSGGFVGSPYNANGNNNYYDSETSGSSYTDQFSTPKLTSQMQSYSTFSSNWDISKKEDYAAEIWYIDDGNDYPRLWYEANKPETPTSFSATEQSISQIDLSWTKGTDATNTYIEWNSVSSWERGSGTEIYNGTGTSYSHTGLTEDTTYYYQAWSNNIGLWSTYASDSATTDANSAPSVDSFSLDDEGNTGWDLDNNDIQCDWTTSDSNGDNVDLYFTFNKGSSARTPTTGDYDAHVTSAGDQTNYDVNWENNVASWSDYDGTVYVSCRPYDGTDYGSTQSDTFSNGIDGTQPTITDNQPDWNGYLNERTDWDYDVDFSDSTSGLDEIQCSLDGSNWYDISSVDDLASYTTDWYVPSALWDATADGSYTLRARAKDEAGNAYVTNSDVSNFKKDTTDPTGSIDAIADGSQPSSITGSASDNFAGVDSIDIKINDTTTGKCWTGSHWVVSGTGYWLDCSGTTSWSYDSSEVDWLSVAGDTITVYLRVRENAGNHVSNADTEDFIVGYTLDTFIDSITPYNTSTTPLSISATNNGSTPDNVTLWYRWSDNNFTAGGADWWNSDFSKRQKFNISGETSTETDVVVPLKIQYGNGVSSGHTIYCNESCQSDFDDIRFTNQNGTELDYFREMYDDGSRAMFYVQLDWLPTSGRDFYIYYGDATVSTTGSASDTFPVWEGFETTGHIFDSAGGDGISVSRSSDYSIVGDYSGHNSDGTETYKIQLDTSQSFDSDYAVCAWVYNSGQNSGSHDELAPGLAIFGSDGSNTGYQGVMDARDDQKSPQLREEWDYSSHVAGTNPANTGQWYYLKISADASNVYCKQYTVSGYWNFTEWDSVTMSDSSPRSGYFGISTYNQDSSYWDAYRVARNVDFTISSYDSVEDVSSSGSSGNSTEWAEWSDASNPDTSSPWSWSFDFPNSTGYYEFYSIAKIDGETEDTPATADARCNFSFVEGWNFVSTFGFSGGNVSSWHETDSFGFSGGNSSSWSVSSSFGFSGGNSSSWHHEDTFSFTGGNDSSWSLDSSFGFSGNNVSSWHQVDTFSFTGGNDSSWSQDSSFSFSGNNASSWHETDSFGFSGGNISSWYLDESFSFSGGNVSSWNIDDIFSFSGNNDSRWVESDSFSFTGGNISDWGWSQDSTFGFSGGNVSSWHETDSFGFSGGNSSSWSVSSSFGFSGGNSSSWHHEDTFSFTGGNDSSWSLDASFSFTGGNDSSWSQDSTFGFSGNNASSWYHGDTFSFTGGNDSSWHFDEFSFSGGNSPSWNLDNSFSFSGGNVSSWYHEDAFSFSGNNASSWIHEKSFSFSGGNSNSWIQDGSFGFSGGNISGWNWSLDSSFGFSGNNASSWYHGDTFSFTGGNDSSWHFDEFSFSGGNSPSWNLDNSFSFSGNNVSSWYFESDFSFSGGNISGFGVHDIRPENGSIISLFEPVGYFSVYSDIENATFNFTVYGGTEGDMSLLRNETNMTAGTFFKKLSFADSYGQYIWNISVEYHGEYYNESMEFTIGDTAFYEIGGKNLYVYGVLLVIIGFFFGFLLCSHRRKLKRYINIVKHKP